MKSVTSKATFNSNSNSNSTSTSRSQPHLARTSSDEQRQPISFSLPVHLSPSEQDMIKKIVQDFPRLNFKMGRKFTFKAPCTVILGPYEPHYDLLFCHEIGHFLTQKFDFKTDLERLKIERHAWEQAQKLCQKYDLPYDEDFVEQQLDSYRDWLHAKSLCKKCGLTRYQTDDGQYHCPHCDLQG